MKNEKLLRAMDGIDDELIADAMDWREKETSRRRWVGWTAIAACLCLLLTATVGAAKWGVEWWHGQTEANGMFGDEEQGYTPETAQVSTVEWKYPLAPVTIRQEAIDEMTEELNNDWATCYDQNGGIESGLDDYHYYTGMPRDIEERITTIGELEEYLGIDLVTSPEVDAAAFNCMETNDIGTWVEISLYGDINRDAEEEYTRTDQISLHGLRVIVRMGYSGTNCKSWFEIYIPLTQKFADTYPAEVVYDTWDLDTYEADAQQFSDREVLVVWAPDDDLEDISKAYGVYGADGIGYCVHCLAEDWDNVEEHPTVYQHGIERLTELLENLE